ncbi:MAG: PAS domain S-box protein, partial [Desulfomonilaceae bacterium]
MFQRPASLRYSLIIVFVLGLIPCVGLTLYGNIQQRRLCLAKAQESVFLSAVDLAEVLGLVIDQTHHMLQALSLEPAVRRLDKKSCPVFFNQNFVKKAFPIYSNLGLANLQGQLVCSAFPGSEVGALSDLSYFKAIINTKQFSVGIDRMTGSRSSKKELFIGYPVFNDSGSLTGVVFASLKVDWLDHLVNHAWAPANATLTVMDAKGNILASSANTEKRIAQAPRESDIVQKVLQKGTGRAQGDDIDGIRKIYGFKQVGGQSGNLYVYVGIPSSDVVVSGNRLLFFDLVWLLIAIIVAILSVWVCTYYIISRQMNTLMTGIHKITAGDLSARTGLDPNKGEIGFLGSAFDKMAQAIQERELEREKIQDALEKEKYFSEMVIDSLPGVFYLFDASGRIIRWNRNTETITGYSAEELSQMRAQDFVPDYERTVLVERIGQALDHGETAMEAHYVTKNGEEIPYYFTGKTIQIDSTKKILGVGLDISDRKKVETALQENEQLLKTILAASPVGIHIAENREIKWANHAWVDMFGFDRESDYVGQSASLLYQSVEEFERVGTVLYRGLKFTDVTETEAKMKRQDGTFF